MDVRVRFEETDLYRLTEAQRRASVDTLVSGAPLPYVILGNRVVCTGSLDAELLHAAVLTACEGA